MNKNDYFGYNGGGGESPLAMIQLLNKNKQHQQVQQQSSRKAVNPHRPISVYNKQQQQQQPNVVRSTAHTSIQKLVKLDTELLVHPHSSSSSSSNYLIKYPLQVNRKNF